MLYKPSKKSQRGSALFVSILLFCGSHLFLCLWDVLIFNSWHSSGTRPLNNGSCNPSLFKWRLNPPRLSTEISTQSSVSGVEGEGLCYFKYTCSQQIFHSRIMKSIKMFHSWLHLTHIADIYSQETGMHFRRTSAKSTPAKSMAKKCWKMLDVD